MAKHHIQIGEAVSDSPVSPGSITDFTDAGFPQVNHVAVAWLECEGGTIFDPWGVRDAHKAQRAQAQQKGPQQ